VQKGHKFKKQNVYLYTVFKAQADWTLILLPTTSCESDGPLAEKNAAVQPVQVAHTVYFFC
jgi:hypothetical protein